MKAKVSIIIAAYNVEKWIERCLESVMEQTYQNYEIIIVNDGSTDRTADLINQYQNKLPDKMHVLTQDNQGLSASRNRALQEVSGKYLTFLDADDYIQNDYLEKLVEKAESEKLDCVVCGYTRIKEDGSIIEAIIPDASNPYYKVRFMAGCFKLYKTDYVNSLKIHFEVGKIFEDIPVSWELMYSSEHIGAIEEAGYMYTCRLGSISQSDIQIDKVPFNTYRTTISKLLNKSLKEKKIFEYSVMSFCTYLLFVQSKKKSKEIKKEIISFCYQIFNQLIPDYISNPLLGKALFSKSLPISQKWGIYIFAILVKCKMLNLTYLI